jgi:hypothetical protein
MKKCRHNFRYVTFRSDDSTSQTLSVCDSCGNIENTNEYAAEYEKSKLEVVFLSRAELKRVANAVHGFAQDLYGEERSSLHAIAERIYSWRELDNGNH